MVVGVNGPLMDDLIGMVADLHRHEVICPVQAVDILADLTGTTAGLAAVMLREWEREVYGTGAERWTPPADDWRRPERGPDGSWG